MVFIYIKCCITFRGICSKRNKCPSIKSIPILKAPLQYQSKVSYHLLPEFSWAKHPMLQFKSCTSQEGGLSFQQHCVSLGNKSNLYSTVHSHNDVSFLIFSNRILRVCSSWTQIWLDFWLIIFKKYINMLFSRKKLNNKKKRKICWWLNIK